MGIQHIGYISVQLEDACFSCNACFDTLFSAYRVNHLILAVSRPCENFIFEGEFAVDRQSFL